MEKWGEKILTRVQFVFHIKFFPIFQKIISSYSANTPTHTSIFLFYTSSWTLPRCRQTFLYQGISAEHVPPPITIKVDSPPPTPSNPTWKQYDWGQTVSVRAATHLILYICLLTVHTLSIARVTKIPIYPHFHYAIHPRQVRL